MSMNLIYTDNSGSYAGDFRVQTTTEVTYSVLKETDKEKQYAKVKVWIDECYDDPEYRKELLKDIRKELFKPHIRLGMI